MGGEIGDQIQYALNYIICTEFNMQFQYTKLSMTIKKLK